MPARTPVLNPAPAPLNLGLIFAAFRRALPGSLAAAVIVGGLTAGVLTQVDPVFEVRSQVSLGAPTDTSVDPEAMDSLVPLYSTMITDTITGAAVTAETGVAEPEIAIAETIVPGVLEVATRGESLAQAQQVADAVMTNLNTRSAQLYADSVNNLQAEAQRRIALIQGQIDARLAADPEADIADLQSAVEQAAAENSESQLQNTELLLLSQSNNEGSAVWPMPLATALVAALLAFLLVVSLLTLWFLRRTARADSLWLRILGHRYGVDTELARALGVSGLTPNAEARAAAALSRGEAVLLLGDVVIGHSFKAYDEAKIHQVSWQDAWWREVAPAGVGLGIVVIDKGDKRAKYAAIALERLVDSGIPAFLTVRGGKRKEES
ncbi:hypothetical protein [Corynebacterium sp. A21]|uniref:hypothetical protein n=1 Tax=Corynebacterium sp. A21 TaxID=3457318 RepID=UPI003FD1F3F4